MSYPARMQYVMTRSGYALARVPEREPDVRLPIAWYAPKPAGMDHIPGTLLCFRDRHAFLSYLNRR